MMGEMSKMTINVADANSQILAIRYMGRGCAR